MNSVQDNTLYKYELVDWNKPKPVIPQTITATRWESQQLNKGFALNGFTKRWVMVDYN